MKVIDLEPRAGDVVELLAAMANPKRLLICVTSGRGIERDKLSVSPPAISGSITRELAPDA